MSPTYDTQPPTPLTDAEKNALIACARGKRNRLVNMTRQEVEDELSAMGIDYSNAMRRVMTALTQMGRDDAQHKTIHAI